MLAGKSVVLTTKHTDEAETIEFRGCAYKRTPSEVSGIASAIDVPVYVVAVVPAIDDPWSNRGVVSEGQSTLRGSLRDLAEFVT